MSNANNNLVREKKTISEMIRIYCCGHHEAVGGQLCGDCQELLEYAIARLDKCPYAPDKGPCSKCQTHCYKPSLRDMIREVMKYSGPRMLLKHPVLAVKHLIRQRKGTGK